MNKDTPMVYLNFQLPERELDWLINTLLPKMNPDEHLWVLHEQEHGDNARLHSAFEKVTGRASTAGIRLLCCPERAKHLLNDLRVHRKPEGIQWQIQPLLGSGYL